MQKIFIILMLCFFSNTLHADLFKDIRKGVNQLDKDITGGNLTKAGAALQSEIDKGQERDKLLNKINKKKNNVVVGDEWKLAKKFRDYADKNGTNDQALFMKKNTPQFAQFNQLTADEARILQERAAQFPHLNMADDIFKANKILSIDTVQPSISVIGRMMLIYDHYEDSDDRNILHFGSMKYFSQIFSSVPNLFTYIYPKDIGVLIDLKFRDKTSTANFENFLTSTFLPQIMTELYQDTSWANEKNFTDSFHSVLTTIHRNMYFIIGEVMPALSQYFYNSIYSNVKNQVTITQQQKPDPETNRSFNPQDIPENEINILKFNEYQAIAELHPKIFNTYGLSHFTCPSNSSNCDFLIALSDDRKENALGTAPIILTGLMEVGHAMSDGVANRIHYKVARVLFSPLAEFGLVEDEETFSGFSLNPNISLRQYVAFYNRLLEIYLALMKIKLSPKTTPTGEAYIAEHEQELFIKDMKTGFFMWFLPDIYSVEDLYANALRHFLGKVTTPDRSSLTAEELNALKTNSKYFSPPLQNFYQNLTDTSLSFNKDENGEFSGSIPYHFAAFLQFHLYAQNVPGGVAGSIMQLYPKLPSMLILRNDTEWSTFGLVKNAPTASTFAFDFKNATADASFLARIKDFLVATMRAAYATEKNRPGGLGEDEKSNFLNLAKQAYKAIIYSFSLDGFRPEAPDDAFFEELYTQAFQAMPEITTDDTQQSDTLTDVEIRLINNFIHQHQSENIDYFNQLKLNNKMIRLPGDVNDHSNNLAGLMFKTLMNYHSRRQGAQRNDPQLEELKPQMDSLAKKLFYVLFTPDGVENNPYGLDQNLNIGGLAYDSNSTDAQKQNLLNQMKRIHDAVLMIRLSAIQQDFGGRKSALNTFESYSEEVIRTMKYWLQTNIPSKSETALFAKNALTDLRQRYYPDTFQEEKPEEPKQPEQPKQPEPPKEPEQPEEPEKPEEPKQPEEPGGPHYMNSSSALKAVLSNRPAGQGQDDPDVTRIMGQYMEAYIKNNEPLQKIGAFMGVLRKALKDYWPNYRFDWLLSTSRYKNTQEAAQHCLDQYNDYPDFKATLDTKWGYNSTVMITERDARGNPKHYCGMMFSSFIEGE